MRNKLFEVPVSNNVIVRRSRVIGSKTLIYSAWEPSRLSGEHRTLTTIDGRWYGKIGTNPRAVHFAHLPAGKARSAAVGAAFSEQFDRARAAIVEAFPELRGLPMTLGEIETNGEEYAHLD